MLQTATINYNSPTHAGLANLHPSNAGNINGRIISRSPTAVHLADQRNLSPNKLNATKKPLFGQNQNANTNVNMVNLANFVRGKAGTSPTAKIGNLSPNYANGYQNYNSNNIFQNTNRQPLLNSNGYGNKAESQLPSHRNNFCRNHQNKPVEFYTMTDSGQTGYCQKCAINLASKGFSVTKINQRQTGRQDVQNNYYENNQLEKFYQPHLVNVPGYSQIEKFINHADSVYYSYLNQIQKYQNIDQHYQHQYQITQNFYDQLLQLVCQMKNDHLNDLKNQAKKHSQIALIKQDQLKSDIPEMLTIRNDLIQTIEEILSDFSSQIVQQTFGWYKETLMKLHDRIQEEGIQFGKIVINEKEGQLKVRLRKIQEYLLNVWNEKKQNKPQPQQQQQLQQQPIQYNRPPINPQPNSYRGPTQQRAVNQLPQDRSPRSVKHLMNLNTKQEAQPKKVTAYRKLFEDDNENLEQGQEQQKNNEFNDFDFESHEELGGQKSPQFKNI